MADIRISELPLATGPTAPQSTDVVPLDGASTRKASLSGIADAIRPVASQADAETGVNNVKVMTALTTKQSIVSEIGDSIQAYSENLDTLSTIVAGDAGGDILSLSLADDVRDYLNVPPYVSSRNILKDLVPTKDQTCILQEIGRGGIFNFRSGDFTASIAQDSLEGCYIKANSVAASLGAWVRQDGGWLFGEMRAEWFGFVDSESTGNATVNRNAIQSALNLRYYLRGGVVKFKGCGYINDFLAIPASCILEGDIRHNILREYGDTTGGVAHPNTGSILLTTGGTNRLWTDESGTGSDPTRKVAIALLGENAGVRNFTLQTSRDSNSWDAGVQVCGVSRYVIQGMDIRGAWKDRALRLDATWSRTSTNMMATAFLPSWFDANYKVLYDYGLTNGLIIGSRFEGAGAFSVEGGPNVALSTNGISDTVVIASEFYNDDSSVTLATRTGINGSLMRFNYRVSGLGGAQGITFYGCRFDDGSRWMFDFDYWSNIDFVNRCFGETSQAYQDYQVSQGVPSEQVRGRIRTTVNTATQTGDVLRFAGEFFCNVSAANSVGGDNGENVTPISWNPRGQAGRRIIFETGAFSRTFDDLTQGESGGRVIRSAGSNGLVQRQSTEGGILDTYLHERRRGSGLGEVSYNGTVWYSYDEGQWTPTIEGATTPGTYAYSVQSGSWTRNGRVVRAKGSITLSAITVAGTGQIRIAGLPFVSRNNSANASALEVGDLNAVSLTANTVLAGFLAPNAQVIGLTMRGSTGDTNMQSANLTATSRIRFEIEYEI